MSPLGQLVQNPQRVDRIDTLWPVGQTGTEGIGADWIGSQMAGVDRAAQTNSAIVTNGSFPTGAGVTGDLQYQAGQMCGRIVSTGADAIGTINHPWYLPIYEGANIFGGPRPAVSAVAIWDVFFAFASAASQYPRAGSTGLFWIYSEPAVNNTYANLPDTSVAANNRTPFGLEAVDDGAGGQGWRWATWDVNGTLLTSAQPSGFAPLRWNHGRAQVVAADVGQPALLSTWLNGEPMFQDLEWGGGLLETPAGLGVADRCSLALGQAVEGGTSSDFFFRVQGRYGEFDAAGIQV